MEIVIPHPADGFDRVKRRIFEALLIELGRPQLVWDSKRKGPVRKGEIV